MDPKTKELIDGHLDEERVQFRRYLAGAEEVELLPNARGEGTMLTDAYGDKFFDFSSAGAVLVSGHRDPAVIGAVSTQINNAITRGHYGQFVDTFVVRYAKAISERFPLDRDKEPWQVLFLTSVHEARQAAAALCVDPVHGSGAGFVSLLDGDGAPREGGAIQDEVHKAKARGFKIVSDESSTDYGRTGTFCLYEQFGFAPDAVILGPAGGAGFPFAAVIGPKEMFGISTLNVINHMAHPVTCAAGSVVIEQITDELLTHVRESGEILREQLGSLCEQFSHVLTAALGVGMLWTIKLNQPARATEFRHYCRKAGLLISPNLRLTPPLTASEVQLRYATDAIAAACIDMGG